MALSRFAQSRVFDTTGLAGTDVSPNDASQEYYTFTLPSSPSNVTPVGIGSKSRGKYRFPQVAQLVTTDTLSNRDEFDEARSYST